MNKSPQNPDQSRSRDPVSVMHNTKLTGLNCRHLTPSDFELCDTNDAAFRRQGYDGSRFSPTVETYGVFQIAYDFFNQELFQWRLPPCLITLQRKSKRTRAFFAADRFSNTAGATTDEIALNPRHFKHRTFLEVMSTFVHEMVHLSQHHHGHRSRNGYHTRAWAEEMELVGLRPSDTGRPGGRKTGQQMSHYIISGGRFEEACRKLQASPLAIYWFDADGVFLTPGVVDDPLASTPTDTRSKFTCSVCDANAWGKPSLNLFCGDCNRRMVRC